MYTNDKKAPRMRKKEFSEQVITRALYIDFKKKNPEYKAMKWLEFRKLWLDIAETIRHEVIYNPLGVKLGSYTGELKLQKLPTSKKDFSLSAELGEDVNHLNLMTRGKTAIIKWERRWAVRFNRMLQFFAFSPTRDMNNLAKKRMDEEPDTVRTVRNTLGGYSIWRQLKNTL